MKRTILMLIALLLMAPAALLGQENESLFNGWGVGFQVGVGGMVPTGSLGDNFKGCALFTGGLNGEVNQFRIKADVAYGQPSFKNENPYAVYDDQNRNKQLNATANPTLLGYAGQFGYTVWQQGRVSVTPMVGFAAGRLSWDINHIKYEKDDEGVERPMIEDVTGTHENTVGWMVNVDVDIKLHGKLVAFGNGQAHYTSSLRISPFINQARFRNFNPSVKGCCVGVTVSYAGLLRPLTNQ